MHCSAVFRAAVFLLHQFPLLFSVVLFPLSLYCCSPSSSHGAGDSHPWTRVWGDKIMLGSAAGVRVGISASSRASFPMSFHCSLRGYLSPCKRIGVQNVPLIKLFCC